MIQTKKKTIKKTTKKTTKKKPVKKKEAKIKAVKKKVVKKAKYWEGIGRRKTASARVRIFSRGTKEFIVNKQKLKDYFSQEFLPQKSLAPLDILNLADKFRVSVKVKGGGNNAQAEAIRHGLARALEKFNANFRKKLKKAGYLTRDPRMKERKKFGLKKARRAPQWRKR